MTKLTKYLIANGSVTSMNRKETLIMKIKRKLRNFLFLLKVIWVYTMN